MTKSNVAKAAAIEVVAKAYVELKNGRAMLIAKHMAMVEEEMEDMRRQFSELVIHMFEDQKAPLSVAEIARAMGTSDRGTVYKYLKDARDRRQNQFLDEMSTKPLFEWLPEENELFVQTNNMHYAVQDIRSGEKWRIWGTGPEEDYWYIVAPWTNDHYSTKLETYKPGDEFPDHVLWFIDHVKENEE